MLHRPKFRRRTLACLALLAAAGLAHAEKAPAPIDPFLGEWAVKVQPDADAKKRGESAFSDAVLFHDGRVSGAVLSLFGFAPGTYTIAVDTGRPVFTAKLTNGNRGTLLWTGRETPTGLTGTLVWTRADDKPLNYTITGERL